MEMYNFSLMCTFKKAINKYDAKVDVQKGAYGLDIFLI